MSGFVVAIPVGPSASERDRAADLLDALRAWEPRARAVVLVDDAPGERRWPAGVAVVPNPRRGRGIGTLGGTCTATLAALRWAVEHHPGDWVLRLDTDALVIGPFAQRVEEAFARHPDAGILGSCQRTCNGEERDLSWWDPVVRKHARAVWAWRRPPLPGRWVAPAVPEVRRLVRAALARGYRPGEHCMAAGSALSAPFVAALAAGGHLERPERWLRTLFGDDVMLGALARALGFDLRDLHEVFGLRHIGLPDAPPALEQRGFAVIHSVKNDPVHVEDDVRAYFQARRPRVTADTP